MEKENALRSEISRMACELLLALREKTLKIAFAESMTGGLLSASLTCIPGASSVLLGSAVCYDAESKRRILQVDELILRHFGAESSETTQAMAEGISTLFPDAGVQMAITGSASAPVNEYRISSPPGMVYYCYGLAGQQWTSHTAEFSGSRQEVLEMATLKAFSLILDLLRQKNN